MTPCHAEEKATVLSKLRHSIATNPPPDDEKWILGPAENIDTQQVTKRNVEGKTVTERLTIGTDIRTGRVAYMRLKHEAKKMDADKAIERWYERMYEVISKEDLEAAPAAIKAAQAKTLVKKADQPAPSADVAGKRFITRATLTPRAITLELHWIDRNDPEAKQALRDLKHFVDDKKQKTTD